jgi:hypothetical protein
MTQASQSSTKRNALVLQLIPIGFFFAGQIIANVIQLPSVGSLAITAGAIITVFFLLGMLGELKRKTNDAGFTPWFVLIPCFNLYFLALKVPEQVTKAKQTAGSQLPTRSALLYLLLPIYALASDLNDLP